jgi:hypothetical protein
MTLSSLLRLSLPGLAAFTVLAGCSSHDVVTTATRPGKYRLYGCDQLNKRGVDLVKREGELQGLMQKAKQAPGGELAVAVAYQNEYNINQSDLHEIEVAGAERKCQLKYRSVSERAVR